MSILNLLFLAKDLFFTLFLCKLPEIWIKLKLRKEQDGVSNSLSAQKVRKERGKVGSKMGVGRRGERLERMKGGRDKGCRKTDKEGKEDGHQKNFTLCP